MDIEKQKSLADAWFRQLRDRICSEFEKIEEEYHDPSACAEATADGRSTLHAPRFTRTPWQRDGGGGGEMSLIKGGVFEKAGVNISAVHGEFSEAMRQEIPGAADNPHFWAGGISLVAHPRSPLVPAVHMNTRMIVVSHESLVDSNTNDYRLTTNDCRSWFGGGADLTPIYPNEQDTQDFHAAFKKTCDAFDPDYYPKYKKWCDEYFFLKHRHEPRGVGGIFYDYVDSGDWEKDFSFTQAVGKAFLEIYPAIVRRRMGESWTPEQREQQLKKRGRYVEFNLLYDRGTRFGLQTGGNVEAILMSLPPEVKWP